MSCKIKSECNKYTHRYSRVSSTLDQACILRVFFLYSLFLLQNSVDLLFFLLVHNYKMNIQQLSEEILRNISHVKHICVF